MAALGSRTFNEMIGQTQMLDQSTLVAHWKAKGLDFSKLFVRQKEQPQRAQDVVAVQIVPH